jgi:AcrR family transcriptional regulator
MTMMKGDTILSVVEAVGAVPGLRERKKQRTRSMLIDAAVQLCDRQGYDGTTVDQIAAIADVSPRTFSRYFATKDSVILALIDDMVDVIAAQLAQQPPELAELEALLAAHIAMIRASMTAAEDGFTTARLKMVARIVNSSPGLRLAASEFRTHAVTHVLAKRLGVTVEDRKLRLLVAVWSAILVTAFGDLGPDADWQAVDTEMLITRLNDTYKQFGDICAVVR